MIIFDLSCEQEHHFEGWFASSEDFDQQQERGLVSCPRCNSSTIRRIPSAAHIAAPRGERQQEAVPDPHAMVQQLVQTLIQSSEDVGTSFAEEARKIHYQESPARSIRGQATQNECSELQEEGIDVLRLPVLNKESLN